KANDAAELGTHLKRKRNRETRPARQAQHKFATILDAMLSSLSYDTGKAMKGHRVPGNIRPSSRAGIIFLRRSMSNHSRDRISVPCSHNNPRSDPTYRKAMG